MKVTKLELRARPPIVRFSIVGVSGKQVHMVMTHAGLSRVLFKEEAEVLYITDLKTMTVYLLDTAREMVEFHSWWRAHYFDNGEEFPIL